MNLELANMDQIVISDKFKYNDDDFKNWSQRRWNCETIAIILPQMSGYIKYFENGGENMSFVIKLGSVLDKYNEIWNKIKGELNIKFHSIPVYDEKYIKAKVREFNRV